MTRQDVQQELSNASLEGVWAIGIKPHHSCKIDGCLWVAERLTQNDEGLVQIKGMAVSPLYRVCARSMTETYTSEHDTLATAVQAVRDALTSASETVLLDYLDAT